MTNEIPSIVHHISIGTNDHAAAVAFYDAIMPTIGAKKLMEFPGAAAYGKQFPEFWVQMPMDGQPATPSSGAHFCFIAPDTKAVDAFYAAAISAGATDEGAPGPRPDYGPAYYGAFVRDLDGHKIEAAIVVAE